MNNNTFLNPDLSLSSQIPEGILNDSENFVLFLKAYYEWLSTTELNLSDGITGSFILNEIVVGSESGAKALIKRIANNLLVVQVTTNVQFNENEIITGQTSNAVANLINLKDNILRRSGNLLQYRNLATTVDIYSDYLKEELYANFPKSLNGNDRLVARKLKDYYESKGQEQSFRFLFKTLYDSDVEIIYPGENILRVSDGNFSQIKTIRAVITSDIFDFLFKTIRGVTSNSVANVVDIKLIYVENVQIAEFTLALVSGTFLSGESIVDIDNNDLTTTLYGMVTGFNIVDAGSGYQVDDPLIINGNGTSAFARVSAISRSHISSIIVPTIGHGYRKGTKAVVNNTGTGGSGLIVEVTEIANSYTVTDGSNNYTVGEVTEVKIINRGSKYFSKPTVTLIDQTIKSLGLVSENLFTISNSGNNYVVGDWLSFNANTGSGANAIVSSVVETTTYDFLFEDGTKLLNEQKAYKLKQEDWNVSGPISRLEVTNFGLNYDPNNLPTITINTATGSNGQIIVSGLQGTGSTVQVDIANNDGGIGSIRAIEIVDPGIGFSTATVDATGSGDGNANVQAVISGLAVNAGKYLNDDGKINYKKIQDSYYYQDFSYVIKGGLTVEKYISTIKKSIHPAGLQLFGEILLIDNINVTSDFQSVINIIEKIKDTIIQMYGFVTVEANTLNPPIKKIFVSTVDSHFGYSLGIDGGIGEEPIGYYLDVPISVLGDQIFGIYPSSITELGQKTIFLTRGGDDTNRIESVPATSPWSRLDYRIEIFVDNASTALVSDIEFAQTGTREVVVDKISFVYAYATLLKEVKLSEVANMNFYEFLDEEKYQQTYSNNFATSTFYTPYQTYQKTQTEIVKILPVFKPEEFLGTEGKYTLSVYSRGNSYRIIDDIPLSVYSSNTISSLLVARFEQLYDIVEGTENYVSMSPSPLPNGIAERGVESTDTVFREYVPTIFSQEYAYYEYGDLFLSEYLETPISELEVILFEQNYETIPTYTKTNKYAKISGVVISDYSTPYPVVLGNSTNFTADFAIGDPFVANNELFFVASIANSTFMTVDRTPSSPYSNIFAYKQI